MQILLITTAEPGERFVDDTRHNRFPQLAMPSVAACTPPDYDIIMIDEKVEPLDELPETDIAGITCHTTVAPRVYALANQLRKRGTFVVLGGPHVTALPHEALQHADAVVVGDAEDTWPRVLEDHRKGKNQKIYYSQFLPLDDLKPPRLDLLRQDAYPTMNVAHATRGCPYRCEFCSVPGVSGKLYRHRPVEKVAAEVARMKGGLGQSSYVIFWDDNLTSDKKYAEALFEALKPVKKKWIGQATTVFARDRELVRKAAEAGCVGLFLGVESFNTDSLRSVKKGFNRVDKYEQAFKNLRDYGIMVGAGIIFGFDHDDPSTFQTTLDYLAEHKVPAANFNMLTPFPGTPLYDRMKEEGRILTDDWSLYQPNKNVIFKPKNFTPQELVDGHRWAVNNFYKPMPILKRVWHSPLRTKHFTWFMNWHYWRVKDIFWDQTTSVPAHIPVGNAPQSSTSGRSSLKVLGQS